MQVRVHASSVNTSAQEPEGDTCTVAIFEEVTRNDAFLYVTACTLLRPHFLPLVAAHLVVAEEPQASAPNLRYYAEIHSISPCACNLLFDCDPVRYSSGVCCHGQNALWPYQWRINGTSHRVRHVIYFTHSVTLMNGIFVAELGKSDQL